MQKIDQVSFDQKLNNARQYPTIKFLVESAVSSCKSGSETIELYKTIEERLFERMEKDKEELTKRVAAYASKTAWKKTVLQGEENDDIKALESVKEYEEIIGKDKKYLELLHEGGLVGYLEGMDKIL